MRKLFTVLAIVLSTISMFAQAPEKMTYQVVVRNSEQKLVTNTNIGMQFSILQKTATGTAVYVERHFTKTNMNGLATVKVGEGTKVSGTFSKIDWEDGPYFIKTEIDLKGGANYTISSTSQLLSVPYALYAKKAEIYNEKDPLFSRSAAKVIKNSDIVKWNHKVDQGYYKAGDGINIGRTGIISTRSRHYVGELFGGGVVFWVDHTGQHGLIVSMGMLGMRYYWTSPPNFNKSIGITAENLWNGESNTQAITNQAGSSGMYAARRCASYKNKDYGTGIFEDWYLPSITELTTLWKNLYIVNKVLDTDKNTNTYIVPLYTYWSSTEASATDAYTFQFRTGTVQNVRKGLSAVTRAIRKF